MKKFIFLRKNWLAITIITCIGLVLRLYKLGQWSFHVDEVATVYHTAAFPNELTINPIIYFLLWLWTELFTINEWSMRFIPAMIGVITIPIFYLPMKKLFKPRAALAACALLSLSPWHLFWSQFARYYTLVFLLGGATAFCFYFALEKNSIKLLSCSLLLAVLTTLSHTPSLLLLPAMVFYMFTLWILPVEKPSGLNRRNFVIVILTIALPSLAFLIPGFFSYLISGWTIQTWGGGSIYVLMSLSYRLGIPTCIVASLSLIHLLRHRDRRGVFLMSFTLFPLAIVLFGAAFANVAAYYLFYTVPLYFLLAGYGATRFFDTQKTNVVASPSVATVSLILILLFSFLAEDFLYFRYQNGGRAKWREAYQTIAKHVILERSEGSDLSDVTVVAPPITAEYYLNKFSSLKRDDRDDRPTSDENKNGNNKILPLSDFHVPASILREPVWFVVYRQGLKTDAKRKLYRWILAHCRLVAEYPVFQIGPKNETIKVFLYEKEQGVKG